MNAIFVLNHNGTQNDAFSCIFVPNFIAQRYSVFAIQYFGSGEFVRVCRGTGNIYYFILTKSTN